MSYRDDVTGLRARTSELERELAEYRAAGPTATDVRVEELTTQRANLARLMRPYLWLLLEPLAWLLIHGGALDATSVDARLAVLLVPPLLAVAHLAQALRRQTRAVSSRRALASAEEQEHAATMSPEAHHAARTAALDAEIREIGHALAHRRDALVRQSAGPGGGPVILLVVAAVSTAMGIAHASAFEPGWTAVSLLGVLGFLLGVASLAAHVGLADETPAALRRTQSPGRTSRAEPSQVAGLLDVAAPPRVARDARVRNDYALELARHEVLEAELASYRYTGKSGPAMRLFEITREARAVGSRWQPFTWLIFELVIVALARTQTLPLSLLDALLVPPGVVLAAFALHACGQAVTLQRRLAFALSERSAFAEVGAGASSRLAVPEDVPAAADPAASLVRAREAEERECARSLRAGRRERRTSFLLFAAAVGAFLASVGSLTPRAGAHGTMVLGMVIGVSVLTAVAALGFLAFALVQVVHRGRLLAIARLATRLERKKLQRLQLARAPLTPLVGPVPAELESAAPELRLRLAAEPDSAPSAPLPPDSADESLDSLDQAADSAESAALARHFA